MTMWLVSNNRGGSHSCEKPCPTMMAKGLGDDSLQQWALEDDGIMTSENGKSSKPPFAVPSMTTVSKIPWNGLTVASTFSGCGGSCLGYRMSGFKVAYANEWDQHARECYIANHGAHIDPRDIRDIKAGEILRELRMVPGELDVLDGSPPCQGFSTAGSRVVSDGRNNLFYEYARLVRGVQPRAFVAENVSGMVKGTMKGIFLAVLKKLKECGYNVRCKVLDAQYLSVPQVRKRVIFIGFRNDLRIEPQFPKPLGYRYSVRDACPWLGSIKIDHAGQFAVQESGDGPCLGIKVTSSQQYSTKVQLVCERGEQMPGSNWVPHNKVFKNDEPCSTIPASADTSFAVIHCELPPSDTITVASPGNDHGVLMGNEKRRKLTIAEVKRICSFPDDFILSGSYANQWARLGNSVPPLMMRAISAVVRDQLLRE